MPQVREQKHLSMEYTKNSVQRMRIFLELITMPTPRPKKLYVVVKKKNPVIHYEDIFTKEHLDGLKIEKDEVLMEAYIRVGNIIK